jgi:hypothetical protein
MAAGELDLRMFASAQDKCRDIPDLIEYLRGLVDDEKQEILLFVDEADEVSIVSTREGTLLTTRAIYLANALFMQLGVNVTQNLEYQLHEE